MKPSIFASIMVTLLKSGGEWEKEYSGNSDEKVMAAYMAGAMKVIHTFGQVTGEVLEKDDEEPDSLEIDSEALETYFTNAVYNLCEWYRTKNAAEASDKYNVQTRQLIMELFRSYSNIPDFKEDDDDGVEGEECEGRHWIFDGVIGAIPFIKDEIVSKDGVVRGLRACADFFEKMDE